MLEKVRVVSRKATDPGLHLARPNRIVHSPLEGTKFGAARFASPVSGAPEKHPGRNGPGTHIAHEEQGMTIPILFENDRFLAADKPEGLSSIPERNPAVPSLVRVLEEARGSKLFVVHRLDKEASGVILFAKDAASHRWLNDLFAARKVGKVYLVLVHGVIAEESGRIDKPIREFGSGRMGVDEARGKRSITDFRVRERLPHLTLLEAHPLTGRRHQLRVHFYSMGHPLVGDLRYGDRSLQQGYPRLMLHALRAAIPLPAGGVLTIESPVPPSFHAVLRAS